MYWFFIPVLIVVILIAVSVAIYASNARRRGPGPGRQPGETVYDENDGRKAPNAPPA